MTSSSTVRGILLVAVMMCSVVFHLFGGTVSMLQTTVQKTKEAHALGEEEEAQAHHSTTTGTTASTTLSTTGSSPSSSSGSTSRTLPDVTAADVTAAAANFPPSCTPEQYAALKKQLPPGSISEKTKCHDPVWVPEFFKNYQADSKLGIYVGCNKGMDALHALRILSNNRTIDKNRYRNAFFDGDGNVDSGPCQQEFKPDAPIPASATANRAVVHCIEAMPVTYRRLAETTGKLGIHESLIVTHTAVSKSDGKMLFPDLKDTIGIGRYGLADCHNRNPRTRIPCAEVSVYSLDNFVKKFVEDPAAPIDILSIDVEGYDFDVLQGGTETLKRVRYLEFEYHKMGSWRTQKLQNAVAFLKDRDFACYWSGNNGELWRMTDCWLDHFEFHQWSNVVCINVRDPVVRPMVEQMEERFRGTLRPQFLRSAA